LGESQSSMRRPQDSPVLFPLGELVETKEEQMVVAALSNPEHWDQGLHLDLTLVTSYGASEM